MRRFLYILISITAALLQACADDASVPRVNATVEIVPQTDVAGLTIDNEQLSFRNLTTGETTTFNTTGAISWASMNAHIKPM